MFRIKMDSYLLMGCVLKVHLKVVERAFLPYSQSYMY